MGGTRSSAGTGAGGGGAAAGVRAVPPSSGLDDARTFFSRQDAGQGATQAELRPVASVIRSNSTFSIDTRPGRLGGTGEIIVKPENPNARAARAVTPQQVGSALGMELSRRAPGFVGEEPAWQEFYGRSSGLLLRLQSDGVGNVIVTGVRE